MVASIGELDEPIIFKSQQNEDDGIGGKEVTFSEIDNCPNDWAKVEPIKGQENTDGMSLDGKTQYRFITHVRRDIKESYVIEWDGDLFNIREVKKPKRRHMYLEIIAETGVAI